jgi:hypothetical protein
MRSGQRNRVFERGARFLEYPERHKATAEVHAQERFEKAVSALTRHIGGLRIQLGCAREVARFAVVKPCGTERKGPHLLVARALGAGERRSNRLTCCGGLPYQRFPLRLPRQPLRFEREIAGTPSCGNRLFRRVDRGQQIASGKRLILRLEQVGMRQALVIAQTMREIEQPLEIGLPRCALAQHAQRYDAAVQRAPAFFLVLFGDQRERAIETGPGFVRGSLRQRPFAGPQQIDNRLVLLAGEIVVPGQLVGQFVRLFAVVSFELARHVAV